MNLQEIYDYGLKHIRTQGKPGYYVPPDGGEGSCKYLTPEGCRCIVGGFIDDPQIALGINDIAFTTVIEASYGPLPLPLHLNVEYVQGMPEAFVAHMAEKGVDLKDDKVRTLLRRMQIAHDQAVIHNECCDDGAPISVNLAAFLPNFENEMKKVARDYKLEYKAP